VLAAQFNSFRDPFIILLGSVPLALFGAGIFMFLKMPFGKFFTDAWTTSFNIYSQVGLVTLVGLVSKNGILIVQFANELQRQGLDKLAAVAQAARIRLRPIMMTSVATVAGHFPLTLVTGAGAAARNSIGLVLVGGMTIGTIFTLFIVPSLYMLIAKEHHEKSLAETEEEPVAEEVTPAPVFAMAPDGNRVAFLRARSGTDRSTGLWVSDTTTGVERLVVDPEQLLSGGEETLPPEERARVVRSFTGSMPSENSAAQNCQR